MGISYKKAISAFRELISANLIQEHRCGRGMPNMIYITKPELTAEDAKEHTKQENSRTADSAYLALVMEETRYAKMAYLKMNRLILMLQMSISRTSKMAYQELPKRNIKMCQNRTQ